MGETSPRKALFYSFLDQYSGLLVNLATTMVLARLLTPDEIGVFAVAVVLVGLVTSIRDMGASGYLIRAKDLTPDIIRATRTIQLAVGTVLGAVVFLGADTVASFYDRSEITDIMWLLAANFLIVPFYSIYAAIWRREMDFQNIVKTRIAGTLSGSIVGISLALQGAGPIALAWASVASNLASLACARMIWTRPMDLSPGGKDIGKVFSFGSRVAVYTIINQVVQGTPELLVGKLQDMQQAGYLSRAAGLVSLFDKLVLSAVNPVVFPHFSRTLHSGGDLGAMFIKVFSIISLLGWLCLGGIAIAVFPIMRILYGGQWDAAIPVTQILCIAAALNLGNKFVGMALITKGAVKLVVNIALVTGCITIIACFFGAREGIEQLAWGMVLAASINSTIWLVFAQRETGFSPRDIAKSLLLNAAIALASLTPLYTYSSLFGFKGGFIDLPVLAPLGLVTLLIFVASSWLLKHPIFNEMQLLLERITGRGENSR